MLQQVNLLTASRHCAAYRALARTLMQDGPRSGHAASHYNADPYLPTDYSRYCAPRISASSDSRRRSFTGSGAISAGTSIRHDHGPAPNNGEGFAKNLSGNQLPNAPHFTTSLTANTRCRCRKIGRRRCTAISTGNRRASARVFNDRPYDKIRGYSTTNLALILTSASRLAGDGLSQERLRRRPPSPATS